MIQVVKNTDGTYTANMSQVELNIISLLVGNASIDDISNLEDDNEIDLHATEQDHDNVYNEFYRYRTK